MDVETVAARSYWHPNGYAKLVLTDSPQGQTRLHIWTETGDGGDIHDHAWDYQSTVLAGVLRDDRYDDELAYATTSPMWRHTYKRTGRCQWAMADPIQAQLAPIGVGEFSAGDQINGSPGTIHRFRAVRVPAVTLIHVGPVRGHSHIYRLEPDPATVIPRLTTPADVAELFALATRLAPDLDLHTLVTG